MKKREKFASRLGFILISAGCAIGLGDVWRSRTLQADTAEEYLFLSILYLFSCWVCLSCLWSLL